MHACMRIKTPKAFKRVRQSSIHCHTKHYQTRCSKENRNQVRKLSSFSLPLALWFRSLLSVAAWIVPMSHELEKGGCNQNDPNRPWKNSFRKHNGSLSPSRATSQASQVLSKKPASRQPHLAPCRLSSSSSSSQDFGRFSMKWIILFSLRWAAEPMNHPCPPGLGLAAAGRAFGGFQHFIVYFKRIFERKIVIFSSNII